MKITVKQNTYIRQFPKQLSELTANQLTPFKAGQTAKLIDYWEENLFLYCRFDKWSGPGEGYVYIPDLVELEGNSKNNQPDESKDSTNRYTGPTMKLPTGQVVYLNAPIVLSGNFTWAEATKNGSRVPVSEEVVNGIIRIANTMEEVREYLGGLPLSITSWYRDPASNRRVGGASRSRHLAGDAVDFFHPTLSPATVQAQLDPWYGPRGGLASTNKRGFSHIDGRGYRARWYY